MRHVTRLNNLLPCSALDHRLPLCNDVLVQYWPFTRAYSRVPGTGFSSTITVRGQPCRAYIFRKACWIHQLRQHVRHRRLKTNRLVWRCRKEVFERIYAAQQNPNDLYEVLLNYSSFIEHFVHTPEPFLDTVHIHDHAKLKPHVARYTDVDHETITIMKAETTRFPLGVWMITRAYDMLSLDVQRLHGMYQLGHGIMQWQLRTEQGLPAHVEHHSVRGVLWNNRWLLFPWIHRTWTNTITNGATFLSKDQTHEPGYPSHWRALPASWPHAWWNKSHRFGFPYHYR